MHIISNTLYFQKADNILIFVIWCNSDLNIHLLPVSCGRKEEHLRHDDGTSFIVRHDQYGPLRYRVSESIIYKKHALDYSGQSHILKIFIWSFSEANEF